VRMFGLWQRAADLTEKAQDASALLRRLTQKNKDGFEKWREARRPTGNP